MSTLDDNDNRQDVMTIAHTAFRVRLARHFFRMTKRINDSLKKQTGFTGIYFDNTI